MNCCWMWFICSTNSDNIPHFLCYIEKIAKNGEQIMKLKEEILVDKHVETNGAGHGWKTGVGMANLSGAARRSLFAQQVARRYSDGTKEIQVLNCQINTMFNSLRIYLTFTLSERKRASSNQQLHLVKPQFKRTNTSVVCRELQPHLK